MWNAQDAKMRKHNEANGGSFKMLCNFHIVRRMMFIVLNVHSFQKLEREAREDVRPGFHDPMRLRVG